MNDKLYQSRLIQIHEIFRGPRITLRLLTPADCTETYVQWLENPIVNKYLETRWKKQDLDSVVDFVTLTNQSPLSYLFGIFDNSTKVHLGNIKIGPINPFHQFADVSYFIGDLNFWGQGFASDAIEMVLGIGFERLQLETIQASLYESNAGSSKALLKCGFQLDGVSRSKLWTDEGRENYLLYGITRGDWRDRKKSDPALNFL